VLENKRDRSSRAQEENRREVGYEIVAVEEDWIVLCKNKDKKEEEI
jgi:hypothetical protein